MNPLQHIAISADGNRRWSAANGLAAAAGYAAAVPQFAACADFALHHSIPYISFHIFNAANWARTEGETTAIMDALTDIGGSLAEFNRENHAATVWVGRRDRIPAATADALAAAEQSSATNPRVSIALYVDYDYLDHQPPHLQADHGFPDFDLYVRPVREYRISGIDPWRIAFAELVFTDGGFPGLSDARLAECLAEYGRRSRTFGR